jgi:hypothetical protein
MLRGQADVFIAADIGRAMDTDVTERYGRMLYGLQFFTRVYLHFIYLDTCLFLLTISTNIIGSVSTGMIPAPC